MYYKFKKLLEERGITTYKVSKDTGISNVTFSNWKNGLITPKVDKLKILSEYFGVSLDYFIE